MPRVDLDGVFERLRRDESEAWRELLEWLRHRMLRLLARRGVDEELAEDVVQESLAIVWQRWDSVREPSRFWSWVVSVVLNRMRSAVARTRCVEPLDEERSCVPGDPCRGLLQAEARNWIEARLATLAPEYRSAVRLRVLEAMEPSEAARRMGVSRARLRRLLHQGKSSFRSSAGGEGERWCDAVGVAG